MRSLADLQSEMETGATGAGNGPEADPGAFSSIAGRVSVPRHPKAVTRKRSPESGPRVVP